MERKQTPELRLVRPIGNQSISVQFDKSTGTFTYTRRIPTLAKLSYSYQWSTTLAGTWTTVVPAVADIVTPITGTDNQTVIVNLT